MTLCVTRPQERAKPPVPQRTSVGSDEEAMEEAEEEDEGMRVLLGTISRAASCSYFIGILFRFRGTLIS